MDQTTTKSLVKYINEARGHGLSNEQIISELSKAGWHVHDVLSVVLDHVHTAGQSPENIIPETAEENIISVQNISKSYGKVKALDDVSLNVRRGTVTALLGPNGAGKTTLVRILATLLDPSSGLARVAGFDAVREAQALRSVIGLAGQYAAVDETLTGKENLEMVGRLYHLKPAEARARSRELLQQFELDDEAAGRPVKTYSGGMRRRLDLAASLVIRPKVLFLDEPTTGLDPNGRFTLWQIIRDLVDGGTTVLLTTQYLEEADQLAHQIFVIDHGKIIASGTPDELKRQVGGDVLELHMAKPDQAEEAVGVIQRFGKEQPRVHTDTGIVTMPVAGAAVLVDVVRELDSAGLGLRDIILRHPSMDDVFMKLTGHEAEAK